MTAPAMCTCGHDRDFFHGGGHGCRRIDCTCPSFIAESDGPSDLTALIDAVSS